MTASVTASTGGVSMITQSNGPLLQVREEAVHPLRRQQLGRVRRRPAGRDHQQVRLAASAAPRRGRAPGRSAGATGRCRSACRASCAARDAACRRRSAARASRPARAPAPGCAAVVVLPSSGWLLVTAMTRVCSLPLVNTSDVRSERNASPKSCGTASVSTGTRSPRIAGTRPSSGTLSRRVMSSGVLTVSSRYSMPNARPIAQTTG